MGQANENGEEEFREKAIYIVRSIRLFHSLQWAKYGYERRLAHGFSTVMVTCDIELHRYYFLSPPPGLSIITESPRTNNISDLFFTVYKLTSHRKS